MSDEKVDVGLGEEHVSKPPKTAKDVEQEAVAEVTSRWRREHAARVETLEQELLASSPGAAPDEKLVYNLAATSSVVAELLSDAQLQLAERLRQFVDQPKVFLLAARSLKEATSTQCAITRSVQSLLSAAGTLRTQRRLTDRQTKNDSWHEDVGGAVPSTWRDSPQRDSIPN